VELRKYPVTIGEERVFPPKRDSNGERQRVEDSFETLLELAGIQGLRFHDLRHTFGSWYMMHGGDLYELAKILGHSNIRMTERYAKLGKNHMAPTSDMARSMWKLMATGKVEQANVAG
jgi:integrase